MNTEHTEPGQGKKESPGITSYTTKGGTKVELSFEIIKKYLVRGHSELVTLQEAMIFRGICKERALNPFANDCYLIKYTSEDPAAIVISIDYFRSRARAQADCQGWEVGVIVKLPTGKVDYTNGLVPEGAILIGGWFEAQPRNWAKPQRREVNLSGYIRYKKDGKPTRFWSPENQPTQIMKVAESQGLRAVWPSEFQGLYTDAELQQLDLDKIEQKPIVIDTTVFDKLIQDQIKRDEIAAKAVQSGLDDFLAETARVNQTTVEEVKVQAADKFEGFWTAFYQWLAKAGAKKERPNDMPELKKIGVPLSSKPLQPSGEGGCPAPVNIDLSVIGPPAKKTQVAKLAMLQARMINEWNVSEITALEISNRYLMEVGANVGINTPRENLTEAQADGLIAWLEALLKLDPEVQLQYERIIEDMNQEHQE
jgi:phage recombination protein Bet